MNNDDQLERNVKVVRMFFEELQNEKRLELYDELFHKDYQFPYLRKPGNRIDTDDNKEWMRINMRSFDSHNQIIETIAQDDRVMVINKRSLTIRSTDEINLLDTIDIGRSSQIFEVGVFHIKDGKIWKSDRFMDRFQYFNNIGLLDRMVDRQTNRAMKDYVEELRKKGLMQ